jgi:hypothetical protein
MDPYTYVRLAFGIAPGDCIHFRSLEFANINRLAPIDGLLPGQALRFGELEFMVDHLGRLRLSKENVAPLHISTPDRGLARAGSTIVDSDALACRVDAYLGANPS